MSLIERDLSYFTLRLQELLMTSFPEFSGDRKFINRRSQLAASSYEGAFRSGNSHEVCLEIAEYILFEHLHFSKFDTVFQIVCREFDSVMADEDLRPFALKMLPVCESVFVQYILGAELPDSPEFDLLYTELTGAIQIWIEGDGLW
jgi:hypothetical protein